MPSARSMPLFLIIWLAVQMQGLSQLDLENLEVSLVTTFFFTLALCQVCCCFCDSKRREVWSRKKTTSRSKSSLLLIKVDAWELVLWEEIEFRKMHALVLGSGQRKTSGRIWSYVHVNTWTKGCVTPRMLCFVQWFTKQSITTIKQLSALMLLTPALIASRRNIGINTCD